MQSDLESEVRGAIFSPSLEKLDLAVEVISMALLSTFVTELKTNVVLANLVLSRSECNGTVACETEFWKSFSVAGMHTQTCSAIQLTGHPTQKPLGEVSMGKLVGFICSRLWQKGPSTENRRDGIF